MKENCERRNLVAERTLGLNKSIGVELVGFENVKSFIDLRAVFFRSCCGSRGPSRFRGCHFSLQSLCVCVSLQLKGKGKAMISWGNWKRKSEMDLRIVWEFQMSPAMKEHKQLVTLVEGSSQPSRTWWLQRKLVKRVFFG